MRKQGYLVLLWLTLACSPVLAQPCPPAGDVNQDTVLTPMDALLAFRYALGSVTPDTCAREQANVFEPETTGITPADALCILQSFLSVPSCLDSLAPRVSAGNDQFSVRNPQSGQFFAVTLDGRASMAADGSPPTYRWRFTGRPAGSRLTEAALTDPTAALASFVPDAPGLYALTLTVTDGRGIAASAAVQVNAQAPIDLVPQPCACAGAPEDVIPLSVRLIDAAGAPVPRWPILATVTQGDGSFLEPPRLRSALAQQGEAVTVTVLTDDEGFATTSLRLGQSPLQVVLVQAFALPNDPVLFRVNLGPLAGNGTAPENLALGGGRGYTANLETANISIFNTAGEDFTIKAVIDLSRVLPEQPGAVQGVGVALNASADRLYVYSEISTDERLALALIAVDTTTNRLVEPRDPDGDGLPGLTLLTLPLDTTAPAQLLGLDFSNLLAVDEKQRRIYAVTPRSASTEAHGELLVIDSRTDALAMLSRLPVGAVPTGVAVNSRTNQIYVTNRGHDLDNAVSDTVTIIDGGTFATVTTITVGHVPLGIKIDEIHNLIYVANLFGIDGLESSGAVSVINGNTQQLRQTLPTSGTSDLAVLVGAQTTFLAPTIDRLYINAPEGPVFDCDVTAPDSGQLCRKTALVGITGKLALDVNQRRLFGVRRFDNAIGVFDVASNTREGEIFTGVSVNGLAVDSSAGSAYISDFFGDRLFSVTLDGRTTVLDIHGGTGFSTPGQVEVDPTNDRIYVISPNGGGGGGIPPLLALDRTTQQPVATLEPTEWQFGPPKLLALDMRRNLLYIVASSADTNRLVVLDGTQLQGNTAVSAALLANVLVGAEDGSELVQGVALDEARNLLYITRYTLAPEEGFPNALVVLRGAVLDPDTRALQQAPQILAEIPGIGLLFDGGRREIALDAERNVIYVAGAFDAISGSVEQATAIGIGGTAITVLDGWKIVDAQGQVNPNPAEALLGILPIKVLPDANGMPVIPIEEIAYDSRELAFDPAEGLLYVVTTPLAPFREGLLGVINSALVLDGNRALNRTPHAEAPEALQALIATLPAGNEPGFLAIDPTRNRVFVTNQFVGGLSVLQGLTVQ